MKLIRMLLFVLLAGQWPALVGADGLVMVRTALTFPEAMLALQESIRDHGYTVSRVQRVDIELTQAAWDELWVDPESKQTVRADAVVFGERLSDVGVRMRGQFSLRESGDTKPWKIDTDFYVEGQEYRNLKQLMFINNIGDPTMVSEKAPNIVLAGREISTDRGAFGGLHVISLEIGK